MRTGADSGVREPRRKRGTREVGRKQSGLRKRQNDEIDAYRQAERETYVQFVIDTMTITLNDPDVMGKDTFGKKRLMRLIAAWGETYSFYHKALTRNDEADYYQEIMDRRLREIYGEDFQPFGERYDWIKKPG